MDTNAVKNELLKQIHALEEEVQASFEVKEQQLEYGWRKGKAWFTDDARQKHKQHRTGLFDYLRRARLGAVLTAPFIYGCLLPFALLDWSMTLYQWVCFPIYGIPRVDRKKYFVYDRDRLQYLNGLEKLNCYYCSYANGFCAYATEIAARTEQHWCPIKHAKRVAAPHSRYQKFFDYGDAAQYARRIEQVRRDFSDLKSLDK